MSLKLILDGNMKFCGIYENMKFRGIDKNMKFCGIHHNMKIPGIHSNKNFFLQRNYEGCLSIELFSLSSASDNYFNEKANLIVW